MEKTKVYYRVSAKICYADKNLYRIFEANEESKCNEAFNQMLEALKITMCDYWVLTLKRYDGQLIQIMKIRESDGTNIKSPIN